jgi:two-component sensor histidine kinase
MHPSCFNPERATAGTFTAIDACRAALQASAVRIVSKTAALKHISTRLYLFALVTAVLVPLLAFGAFLLARYSASEQRRFEAQALQVAYQVALLIDAQLGMLGAMLQALSTSSSLATNDLASFHAEAARLVAGRDAIIVLREFGPHQILNTQLPFGAVLPAAIPLSPSDLERLQEGRSVVSNVYTSPVSGEPRIAVALRAPGEGDTTRVLAITVPTSRVRDALLPAVPAGWIATVGDRNGIIVTRSARHDDVSGKPGRSDFLATATGRAGTFTATGFEGTRMLSGYYRSDFSGWLFGANIPEEIVAAPLWRSLLALGILGAAAIALSALFAYLFGTTFTAATAGLSRRAVALGAGEAVPPMSSRLVELERVSEALSSAAEAIDERERERARSEAQRQLLVNELDHRVKNTLAIVQSIVHQTLRADTSDSAARQAITGRLVALAETHDVLTRESWKSAELNELVAQALRPYGERCRSNGPPVSLAPRLAISLAMALHELATNAAKYGSLSNETGAVDIVWEIVPASGHGQSQATGARPNSQPVSTLEPRRLVLRWSERDGPPVRPPTRQGFGTRLLQRALPAEIGVTVAVEFKPEGLVCVIEAPLVRPLEIGDRA